MSNSKPSSKTVVSYGAALSTAMLATGVDAAVVELNVNPGAVADGSSARVFVSGDFSFSFDFNNNSYSFGRNLYGLSAQSTAPVFGIVASTLASVTTQIASGFGTNVYSMLASPPGQVFVGFELETGNLGFLKFNFDLVGDASIKAFAETVAGQSIRKDGGTPVIPLPATLPLMAGGMLAMGAAGLRKRRKQKAAV